MTSAPTVIDDIVVVGSSIDDNARVDMPSGVVRAFDARTGALRWKWEPLPPNDPDSAKASGGKVWRIGAGNAWSNIVVDPERDLVFVPTGSASPDYYGGLRVGDDKWANSIVALRAKTGELVWGFQLVHHDLWDYDCASPPLLTTVQHDGKSVPVVIQGNKTGFLYVLNRDTGEPVFPVEERSVPQTDVPGGSHLADAAFSCSASCSFSAEAFRRRRLGHYHRRSRLLPGPHERTAQRWDFHASQFARFDLRARKCRRHELERVRIRSEAWFAAGEYE